MSGFAVVFIIMAMVACTIGAFHLLRILVIEAANLLVTICTLIAVGFCAIPSIVRQEMVYARASRSHALRSELGSDDLKGGDL
jgi:hypothetical protein